MKFRIRRIIVVIAVGLLAGCGRAYVAPTPTATLGEVDALATLRVEILETQHAEATIVAQTPTATRGPSATPRPTATSTVTPIPIIDFNTALPYLHYEGGTPDQALTRLGLGWPAATAVSNDGSRLWLSSSSGLFEFGLPTFELLWRQNQYSWRITMPQDNRRLALGTLFGPILIDASTGTRIGQLSGEGRLYWSPDGEMVAVEELREANWDSPLTARIYVYDTASGRLQRILVGGDAIMMGGMIFDNMAWSPGGDRLAACRDQAVYVWDIDTGDLIYEAVRSPDSYGPSSVDCAVAFSPDTNSIAWLDTFESLAVVELASGDVVLERHGPAASKPYNYVTGPLEWLGNRLIVVTSTSLNVLDTTSWLNVYSYDKEYNAEALYGAVSPSGESVALVTSQSLRVVNLERLQEEYVIDAGGEGVFWAPDGSWLISRSTTTFGRDWNYNIYQAATGLPAVSILEEVDGLLFVDEDKVLIMRDHRLLLLDLRSGQVTGGTQIGIQAETVSWSQTGNVLMITDASHTWYWSEQSIGPSLSPPSVAVAGPSIEAPEEFEFYWDTEPSVLISPDGTLSAHITTNGCGCAHSCGVCGGLIEVFEDNSSAELFSIRDFGGEFEYYGPISAAWSPDGTMLAVGLGGDRGWLDSNRILLLDGRTGAEIASLRGHVGPVRGLVFSPDGTRLASISDDGTIIVWNTARYLP